MLNITFEVNESEVVVFLEGKLDAGTASEFAQAVYPHLNTCESMIVDMTDLKYLSSAGLREFMKVDLTMEKRGKSAMFRNISESVMQIIEVTGFSQALKIC